MTDLAIRCRGLVKRHPPDVLAVDGLDLEIERGECFGLLGPNGAGKTTTVEILEGLLAPTAGEVEVLGATWDRDADDLRERLGVTLQETTSPRSSPSRRWCGCSASFYRRGRDVDEVIALVGLEDKRRTLVRAALGRAAAAARGGAARSSATRSCSSSTSRRPGSTRSRGASSGT